MSEDATKLERAWWRQFKRVLDKMPQSMEVLVGAGGDLSAARRGASLAEFNRRERESKYQGDVDNVPTIALPFIESKRRIQNNGSSL